MSDIRRPSRRAVLPPRFLAGICVVALALLSLVGTGAPVAQAADTPSGKLLLMLDASGSMNEPDPSGVTKLAAAQKALTTVVDTLPDAAVVGLRVYGATVDVPSPTPQSCADSQLISPIAPLDRTATKNAIAGFKAVGDTPISYSLEEGVKDLGTAGKRNIVLVSDGQENCVPDPCPAVKALVAAGVDLQIDTVGFGVDDTARKQLQCIADAGRGSYYDAKDAAALSASLTKLSQRALRPFTLSGTPVKATDAPEAGPVLTPGQYTDTFVTGAPTRYYRLQRTSGSTMYVSLTSRPPGGGWDILFEQLLLSVKTPSGESCAQDTLVRNDLKGDAVAMVAHVVVPGSAGSSVSKDCTSATDLVVSVNRPKGAAGEQPMEILVVEEPAVTNASSLPPAAGAAEVAPLLAPATGERSRVSGGGSFSDALTVTPGTYVDTLLPGEQIFYKVRVEFGQRAAFTVDAPAPGQDIDLGNFARIFVSTQAWTPDRFPLERPWGEPKNVGVMIQTIKNLALGEYLLPVRYQNRDAKGSPPDWVGDSLNRTSLAGYYYFAVARSRARESEPKESVPLDVRIRVAVEGQPAGQPAYATPTAAPTTGPSAGPTGDPTGSETTGPAEALGSQPTSGSSPSVLWAVVGVILLGAAGGGYAWWRRRAVERPRSESSSGQRGGGSQA